MPHERYCDIHPVTTLIAQMRKMTMFIISVPENTVGANTKFATGVDWIKHHIVVEISSSIDDLLNHTRHCDTDASLREVDDETRSENDRTRPRHVRPLVLTHGRQDKLLRAVIRIRRTITKRAGSRIPSSPRGTRIHGISNIAPPPDEIGMPLCNRFVPLGIPSRHRRPVEIKLRHSLTGGGGSNNARRSRAGNFDKLPYEI